jgi:hypothetical protein
MVEIVKPIVVLAKLVGVVDKLNGNTVVRTY